jgi:hypothetical protein
MGVIVKAGLFGALAVGALAGASQLDWRGSERPATPSAAPSKIGTGVQPAPPIAAMTDTAKTTVETQPKPAAEENKATPQKARKKNRKRRRA